MAAHQLVYHWKHGWIPRDHFAALQKAHGSHKGAARIMQKHGITPDPGRHGGGAHASSSGAKLHRSDVHRDGRTDEYRLPSGHIVSVDRATGRVHNPFTRNGSGQDAVDANPHLLEKKSIGTSLTHDDHYVLKGHKPPDAPAAKPAPDDRALSGRLSMEDLRVAQQRGQMTPQRVADYVEETKRIAAQVHESRSAHHESLPKAGPVVVGTLSHHDEIVTVAKTNGKHRVKIDGRNHGGPHDTHEAALAEAHSLVPPHRRASTEEEARAKALEINRQAEADRITKVRERADAAAKAAAEPHTSDARVQIDHSGDGTLLHIDRSDTEARAAAKAAGFKWSSNLGSWYLPRNWSESTRRGKVEQLRTKLGHENVHVADAGHGVTTSAAEREAAMRARAVDRADRMDARAAKAAQEAESRRAASDRITDLIPMGQPILVGHHSEGRHRRDIARSHSHMEKSWEADRQAKEAARSAEIARQTAAGDSPLLRQRRIDRNEAEVRKIDRTLQEHDLAVRLTATKPEAAAKIGLRPLAPEHHAQITAARAELADQIAHDKAQIEASGHKGVSAADITPGDVVQYRGRTHVVKKVNKTTVAVPTGYSWDDKVPINQISKHIKLADMPVSAIRSAIASEKDAKVREHFVRELNRRGIHITP